MENAHMVGDFSKPNFRHEGKENKKCSNKPSDHPMQFYMQVQLHNPRPKMNYTNDVKLK